SAAELGEVYRGATVCAWYPITPSSSLADAFTAHCKRLRHDPDTKQAKYAIVQGEDELASIGIVIGAGWNGARAFTATSGPGISLMQEFIGLSYFAEIPAVIMNVQRAGPSTGMPTRTQQCDIISAAYASPRHTKPVPHLSGHPSDQGLVLHPRHIARRIRALHRGRGGLSGQHAAAAAQVRHRQGLGAAPPAGLCSEADQIRRDLFLLDRARDGRGD